jgi:hypothetical protein
MRKMILATVTVLMLVAPAVGGTRGRWPDKPA